MSKAVAWSLGLAVVIGATWFAYSLAVVASTPTARLPNVSINSGA